MHQYLPGSVEACPTTSLIVSAPRKLIGQRRGARATPPNCRPAALRRAYAGEKISWMQPSEIQRALAAAVSTASALGLTVDDAIVLHDSNRLAVRLLPCDVLARVAPAAHQVAQFEVELAQRLAETESPVAALEPRVEPGAYERDGFVVTLWTYYNPVAPREVSPAAYANALERLHAGMRKLDVRTPHFTDRVGAAQQLVESGEPHPGKLLSTKTGLLFIDLETCCRGRVRRRSGSWLRSIFSALRGPPGS
jgi:hypothetical protein